jgi:hypothetical protein
LEIRRSVTASVSVGDSRRAAPASVTLPVRTTPEAEAQVRQIDEWRRENRSSSPDLFLDELTAVFEVKVMPM